MIPADNYCRDSYDRVRCPHLGGDEYMASEVCEKYGPCLEYADPERHDYRPVKCMECLEDNQ